MNTEIKLIVDPTISQEQAGTAFYELEWEMVDIFPPSPTSEPANNFETVAASI